MPEIGGNTAPGFEECVRRSRPSGRRAGSGRRGRRLPARPEGRRPVGRNRRSRDRPPLGARHPARSSTPRPRAHRRLRAPAGPAGRAGPRRTRRRVLAGVRGERQGAHPRPLALTHQAGLPTIDHPITPAEAIAWDPMVTALAAQRPSWEPGTDHGYHGHTYGWLVGEVIRRVTGAASARSSPKRSPDRSTWTCGSGCRKPSGIGSAGSSPPRSTWTRWPGSTWTPFPNPCAR